MGTLVPIGTLPGLTSALDAVDVLIGTFPNGGTLTSLFLRHTDYDDGGATDTSVTGSIRNATGGGGSGIAFVIPDQTQSYTTTGSVAIAAGSSLYLRVTAGSASMNLTGYVELSAAVASVTALTNLARVKLELGITNTTNDTLLSAKIAGVSDEIQARLHRNIAQETETGEKRQIWGDESELYLRHRPLISVGSVTEDDTALVEDTDFEHTAADDRVGRLVRLSDGDPTGWSVGERNIVVTYDHGYAAVPARFVDLATDLVVHDFRNSKPGGARLGLDGQTLGTGGTSGYRSRAEIWADNLPRFVLDQRVDY